MASNSYNSESESSTVEDSEGSDLSDESDGVSVPVARGLVPYQREPRREQGQQQQALELDSFSDREVRLGNNDW